MMNRNASRIVKCGVSALALGAISVAFIGCSGEEEAPVAMAPPPPPPPAAPPPPAVTPIDELMAMLNIDPRVRLPEDKAPDNDIDRKADSPAAAISSASSPAAISLDSLSRDLAGSAKTEDPSWLQRMLLALGGAFAAAVTLVKTVLG